jgi:guanine nucleotide-binding protein subunit alpha
MRFAQTAWEKERNGWRAVVQFNVVRSIRTILEAIQAEIRGDPTHESDEVESRTDNGEEEELQLDEIHSLLTIRLAPLHAVEASLKRRLGPGAESHHSEMLMAATPFDEPNGRSVGKSSSQEFTVRSWKEVLDPENPMNNHPGTDLDEATITIAACKDDMKALWNDKTVRHVLKRRKQLLPDSAGL